MSKNLLLVLFSTVSLSIILVVVFILTTPSENIEKHNQEYFSSLPKDE